MYRPCLLVFFFPPPPPSLTSSPLSVPQVVKLNGPFRGYHGWPLSVCINVKLADFKARGVLANHSQVFVYLRRNLGVVSDCLHQSLLSISHKIFYKNLFPRLAPYIYDIIRYYLCGFRRDRSTVDHIFFCICETLGKTRGAMVECVSYLYGFKESLWLRKHMLYNILIEFCITVSKLVRPMCLTVSSWSLSW
jgi:hypothetical protein